MAQSNSDLCLEALRDLDRDRYLACLLSPQEKRGDLAALYAFNAEIARIRDIVSEPLPGEVRLQYWRDLLEGNAHGSITANPTAAALLETVERHRLPHKTLIDMIDARVFDLYDDPIDTRSALEGYTGETASALIQLASLVLSPEDAARSAEQAGHGGVAQAIAGLLMLMPMHRSRGQVYIPLDILRATGLDRDSFLAGEDKARISAAIDAFAGLGREHLAKARRTGKVPTTVFPAFLTVSLTEAILAKAQTLGAGLFEKPLQSSQWRRQLRMVLAGVTGRF